MNIEDIEKSIKKIIKEKIRPMLAFDGGDIEFLEFVAETGEVLVNLNGACKGCPMASMTLKHGVEEVLKETIPEVKAVICKNLENV